jgi:hypothetical protein
MKSKIVLINQHVGCGNATYGMRSNFFTGGDAMWSKAPAAGSARNVPVADATLKVNGGSDFHACVRGSGGVWIRAQLLFYAFT